MATPRKPRRRHDRIDALRALSDELSSLREQMLAAETELQARLDELDPGFRESARNLVHYLALRRQDIRPLQQRLASLGLSSLGRAESHVLGSLQTVLGVLHDLTGARVRPSDRRPAIDRAQGQQLLADHTQALMGPAPAQRDVRIMVTMPSEAADDYGLVHRLLRQGMDCMRINCAHDDAEHWARMIANLRRAEHALHRRCKVLMDLGGPKLRTGPLTAGPSVVKVRPRRDPLGNVLAPARIWLCSETHPKPPPADADAQLPLPAAWLRTMAVGDRLRLRDARDARRNLVVVETTADGCWAEAGRTCYFVPGLELVRNRDRRDSAMIGPLPAREEPLLLHQGDLLLLTRKLLPGRAASYDSGGAVLTPAHIACVPPEAFQDVRTGESIWFDDGRIGGEVEHVDTDGISVRITHARPRGEKLRSEKGINLPDSHLQLPAMTPKDIEDLRFIAAHADIVALSFANGAEDVQQLHAQITACGAGRPAIVLKIETRRGFEHLPEMLLAAMKAPRCGVMIARGDLAVECGFERLAEVQEEILWICESAHVPVIWATQVLETLAQEGVPSRAEITDAAMADRAECVMLNKGAHIVEAVRVLDDILRRMQAHQSKKSPTLRALHLAQAFTAPPAEPSCPAPAAAQRRRPKSVTQES
ncbi:pyruvate kinase [Solimonas flava]|uniref:pyruvate kinase n=1 Tax=Solimonas flava TaxID=415849 RepID=UPI00041C3BBF|nr:pyruvate kinase [Solimonas flava]